jgi:hypothetical protein
VTPRISRPFLWWSWVLPMLAFIVLLFWILKSAQPEPNAVVFVASTWDLETGCTDLDRQEWEGMAMAWYREITDVGSTSGGVCLTGHCDDAYGAGGAQINGDIRNDQFADKDVADPWGQDADHLEQGAAAMVALHGSKDQYDATIFVGSMREGDDVSEGDSPQDDCYLRSDEMKIGNDGLDFLHFSSCNSMDDDQWSAWQKVYDGAHQIDGFHGLVYLDTQFELDYKSFASDAFYTSIAEAWIDGMYKPHHGDYLEDGQDVQVDQCPVAHAVGKDASDTWARIESERYNDVYEDPADSDYWAVTYFVPCYPKNEEPLLEEPFEF